MAADGVSSYSILDLARLVFALILHSTPLEVAWHSDSAAVAHGKAGASLLAWLGASARSGYSHGCCRYYGSGGTRVEVLCCWHRWGQLHCGLSGSARPHVVEVLGRCTSDSDSSEG